jgi:hypothetical protein
MKNAMFWDILPSGSCKNRLLEEHITSIIKVTVSELGKALAVPRNQSKLHS